MDESIEVIQNLLFEALEIKDTSKRAAFLAEACGTNLLMRQEIEGLLQAEAASGQFLPEAPPAEIVQKGLLGALDSLAGETTASNLPKPDEPGQRIGRYKLLQRIGEGGCGVVFMAEQEFPVRRKVAVKIIKLGMDTKNVVARFEAERQALALMDHPNIAKVLDAGATDAGRPYFVMELVRGIKITDYCDDSKLTTVQRLELFIKVCDAVQHAHQKAIIHRDLKPSNILVTLSDGEAVPKIIDFGIASNRISSDRSNPLYRTEPTGWHPDLHEPGTGVDDEPRY
jgi:hypothetical protein